MSSSNIPTQMKEARVYAGQPVTVQIHSTAVPKPDPDQVLIKVHVSGTNPKDWKIPLFYKEQANGTNSGDDIAGEVVSLGINAQPFFSVGQRVAAFHKMMTPGGSFAEYAVAPYHTTFPLPAHITYESGATIPLAAMTAVVGLYNRLALPEPWVSGLHPHLRPEAGVLIYGAASAVGAFAVQLAVKSQIHPILCVAGNGIPFVESLLDKSKGDVVVDYRKGNEHVVSELKKAIESTGSTLKHAFDCVAEAEKGSFANIVAVLDQSGAKLTAVLPPNKEKHGIPQGIDETWTAVGSVHQPEGRDLGTAWFRLFSQGLQDGWFKGHPYEVIPGGLAGVQEGLQNLQQGKASAIKYVYRIGETRA